ncbi:MAG: hypothetical protein RL095_978, partial [Verrucomicrobiota bacterium]
ASRTLTNVTADSTLTASFAIDTFSVKFLAGANGSITGNATQTVNYGSSSTAVTATPATGYHFVKWSDDSLSISRTLTGVTADISLTASFAIDTSVSTPVSNGQGQVVGSSIVIVDAAGPRVVAEPATGYHFEQWSDGSTLNPHPLAPGATSTDLLPVFAIDNFAVNFAAGANGSITGQASQTVEYGASSSPVTATPASGHHFVSWSDGSLSATRTLTGVTAAISLSASFAADTSVTSSITDGNGNAIGSSTVIVDAAGPRVVAEPATGYHFTQWSDGSTLNPHPLSPGATTSDLVPSFAINTYTLRFSQSRHGRLNGKLEQILTHGSSSSPVSAIPAEGYHFAGWNDGNLDNPRVVAAVSAGAEFSPVFAPDAIKLYSTGMSFTVDAADVPAPNGGKLSQFTKAPGLFSAYFGILDPSRSKALLATHKAVAFTKSGVRVAKLGLLTPADQVTGEISAAPLFYDKKALAAHYASGGRAKTFSQVPWIDMDLRVKTGENGATLSNRIGELRLVRPELSALSTLDRMPATQLKAGQMLRLDGRYFGKKLPKLYFEYSVLGKTKILPCTVLKHTPFPDASGKAGLSCTDPLSGTSTILVQMPKAWPKEWIHGANDLVLDNGAALASLEVRTAAADSSNSAPVALADSAQPPLGRATLIDVLANDHDADNHALKIVLVAKPLHGKLSLSNNAILYTPAAGTAVGTKDSFTYYLQETLSSGKLKSETVTVEIEVVAASALPDDDGAGELPQTPDLNLLLGPGESLSLQLLEGVTGAGPFRLEDLSCPDDDFDLGSFDFDAAGGFEFAAAGHFGSCVLEYTVSNENGETTGQIHIAVGQRICAGMALALAADEVPAAVQDELQRFSKAPSLYSSGLNLFTGAAPKAMIFKHAFIRGFDDAEAQLAKLSALAPAGSLLFECGAKLPLVDRKALAAHYAQGGSAAEFSGRTSEALMQLYLKNAEAGKALDEILTQRPLIFCAPQIDSASLEGASLTLEGRYFGKTLPKVWIETQVGGQTRMLPCTVLKTLDFPDAAGKSAASVTDPTTGASRLHLLLPKGLAPGKHTLVLDNGAALATVEIEVGS